MSIPAHLLVHSASVEAYAGSGAYGPLFGAPVAVPCYAEVKRSLVRDQQGREVVSESTVYANRATTGPASFPVGSRVTVLGRTAEVIAVSMFDDAGITGSAHLEVALT